MVDIGGMAVKVETPHYYVTFCCLMTDDSRGTVWQNGIRHERVYEGRVLSSSMWKNGTHWHSLMLGECLWRPNSGCEHSEVEGGIFQQWWQGQWVTLDGEDFNEHGMQAFVHHWQKCVANGDDYIEKKCFVAENLLYQILLLCSLYLLFLWI